uniref:Protein TsetseEP domain-containing protein n=1 Tax=Stomoxys calcitrans TaxID=35570 RepID=A0A1I8QB90_STOCA
MLSSQMSWVFGALLLFAAANLTQAVNERHDLSVITDLIDMMVEQLEILKCMTRSCDPLALEKMIEIEDGVERDLKAQSSLPETHEYESEKVDKAIKLSVAKYLEVEPKCQDTSYSCPNPIIKELPKYFTNYVNAVQEIIMYGRKCVNLNNIEQAINVLGESVELVEGYHNHAGNYMQRVLPSCVHCSNGFRQLCDEAAIN